MKTKLYILGGSVLFCLLVSCSKQEDWLVSCQKKFTSECEAALSEPQVHANPVLKARLAGDGCRQGDSTACSVLSSVLSSSQIASNISHRPSLSQTVLPVDDDIFVLQLVDFFSSYPGFGCDEYSEESQSCGHLFSPFQNLIGGNQTHIINDDSYFPKGKHLFSLKEIVINKDKSHQHVKTLDCHMQKPGVLECEEHVELFPPVSTQPVQEEKKGTINLFPKDIESKLHSSSEQFTHSVCGENKLCSNITTSLIDSALNAFSLQKSDQSITSVSERQPSRNKEAIFQSFFKEFMKRSHKEQEDGGEKTADIIQQLATAVLADVEELGLAHSYSPHYIDSKKVEERKPKQELVSEEAKIPTESTEKYEVKSSPKEEGWNNPQKMTGSPTPEKQYQALNDKDTQKQDAQIFSDAKYQSFQAGMYIGTDSAQSTLQKNKAYQEAERKGEQEATAAKAFAFQTGAKTGLEEGKKEQDKIESFFSGLDQGKAKEKLTIDKLNAFNDGVVNGLHAGRQQVAGQKEDGGSVSDDIPSKVEKNSSSAEKTSATPSINVHR